MTLFLLGFCFVFLLLLLALVSALETAMYSLREWDGDELGGGEGGHLQKRLRKIRLNPFAQLRQTLLLSAGLNLALALLGFYLVQGPLRELGLPPWWSGGILFVVAVVLGDALPKLHVVGRAEGLVVMGSRLLVPVRLVLDPLAGWADRCADGLLRRLLGVRRRGRVPMTRDEFETLVELRAAQGALSGDEAAMIREVLDLEALIVGDAIVPRVDVSLVSAEAGDDGVHEELEKAAGRFVVLHGETPDEVLGVVDTRLWRVGGKRPWREVMKAAVFVPETMPLLDALEVHLHDDESVVLVVDEYGGFEGLVSQEEIADWLLHEAAPWLGEDAEIREIEKGRYFLDGAARLDHLAEATGVVLPLQGLEGIDTVGGLVFHELGRVPKAGERLRIGNVEIKVRRMARARVKQLEVRLTETALVTAEGVRV